MATITVTKAHTLPLDEARQRARTLMTRIQEKYPRLIGAVRWEPDGSRGSADGKMFSATFQIAETSAVLTVELKGLGASLLAGKVESDLKRAVDKAFA